MNELYMDERSFEQHFKAHFKELLAYACTILKSEELGEEVVQNVFFKLWQNRERTQVHTSLRAYLYRSVHNESMNYLKHVQVKNQHQVYAMQQKRQETDPALLMQGKELEERIRKALNELPEQCRTIFQMSRFGEMKYREIADALQLSVKTVENQMGKALQLMRLKLADVLVTIIIFFFTQKLF
jgi:RNA polymerase sigma-70 factor (ECF subfamily)